MSKSRKRSFLWVVAFIALIYSVGLFNVDSNKVYADTASPDFRISDVTAEYGHMIVEVQFFNADGTHWHFEHFTFQGREQFQRSKFVDSDGNQFLADGSVAPTRLNDEGETVFYAPLGKNWLLENEPRLDTRSILGVINQIYDKRLEEGIPHQRGSLRLITTPLSSNWLDDTGAPQLVYKFQDLIDRSYIINDGKPVFHQKLEPTTIPHGSEYGTVSTFYPSSSAIDGSASESTNATWATIRGDGGSGSDTSGANQQVRVNASTVTNEYDIFTRTVLLFDTSALPDGDSISAATMDVVLVTGTTTDGYAEPSSISMVTTTPASNTGLVDADYAQFGTTKQAPDKTNASFTADNSTYNSFTLNSTGLGNINLTGVTKFGLRVTFDNDNDEPTWASGASARIVIHSRNEAEPGDIRPRLVVTHASPSAAVTGTIGDGATEQEVRDGGGTILITLTDDTWVAAGATFDAQRQNIINGLDAASSPTNGWNNEVRDEIGVSSVVRTSDTIATITISAADVGDYRIDSNETITVTVPSTSVTSGGAITATPTFQITAGTESVALTGTLADGATPAQIEAGGQTAILTLTNTKWVADGSTFNAQRQNIIDGFVSAASGSNGWNNRRSDFAVTDVVRTSDTIATITLSASSSYAIPEAETITVTVPASAMVLGSSLVATPTFTVTPSFVSSGTWVSPAIDLSSITDTAYCAIGWSATTPSNTTALVEYSSDGGSTYSTATSGQCPFSITSNLATVSDFRIKITLSTTNSSVTPSITALGFVAGTTLGQTVRYQLNTTPALTIDDRTGNGYNGTFSFPSQPDGVATTVGAMTALSPASAAQASIGVPQVTSPVTGVAVSANIFNLDETGWATLPGYDIVNTMATAGDGLPAQFIWYIFLGFITIMLGFFALNLTQSLFAAGTAMALGIAASIAIGGGLMPGWTIFVFLPISLGLVLLRPRLAI